LVADPGQAVSSGGGDNSVDFLAAGGGSARLKPRLSAWKAHWQIEYSDGHNSINLILSSTDNIVPEAFAACLLFMSWTGEVRD